MARLEAWCLALLCVGGLASVARTGRASPPASSAEAGARVDDLGRVEIALIGEAQRDPVLFERIRSLFSAPTLVGSRDVDRVDARAVLQPERAGTVYVWIRVTDGTKARVYLAISEPDGSPRYLFRELRLEAGLDEVGSETLAQVAHSSARALWLRERQTPRQELVAALERDTEAQPAAPSSGDALPAVPPPPTAARGEASPPPSPPRVVEPAMFRVALGASDTAHASGTEGWLHEPGPFLALEYRALLSLRLAVRYLVPAEFGVDPARVRLTGASGEVRAGWLSGDASRARVRLEAGLGVLLAHARPSIVAEEPRARVNAPQDFERSYALASAVLEWPFGPAWIAAGADLRVPLRKTSYEVAGQAGASTSSSLSPGGSLEVGFGFDPIGR